jgi:hypothetical protein
MIEDARGNIDYDEEGSGPQPRPSPPPRLNRCSASLDANASNASGGEASAHRVGCERLLNPRTTSLQLRGVEQSAEAD